MPRQHELVRIEPGEVARLTLDRPPLNILDIGMMERLAAAIEQVGTDPVTKVVLLTGAGNVFCAGVDVRDHTTDRVERMMGALAGMLGALRGATVPIVAGLNGAALGGGFEVALCCDVVLARAGARLGNPEIRLGVFPPAATALLPRLIGRQRALDVVLSGRRFEAEEALSMGLVAHVFPSESFHEQASAYAADLATLSRPVLRLAKRAIVEGLDRPVADAMRHADMLYLDELMALHDPHEGLAAFMEKRAPVWSDT